MMVVLLIPWRIMTGRFVFADDRGWLGGIRIHRRRTKVKDDPRLREIRQPVVEILLYVLCMFLAFLPAAFVAQWVAWGLSRLGMVTWIAELLSMLPYWLIVLILWCFVIRHERARSRKRYLEARRCWYCRYALDGAPDSDGCTTCPECGAAWRLNPKPDSIE